jgi:hypothetical protein
MGSAWNSLFRRICLGLTPRPASSSIGEVETGDDEGNGTLIIDNGVGGGGRNAPPKDDLLLVPVAVGPAPEDEPADARRRRAVSNDVSSSTTLKISIALSDMRRSALRWYGRECGEEEEEDIAKTGDDDEELDRGGELAGDGLGAKVTLGGGGIILESSQ